MRRSHHGGAGRRPSRGRLTVRRCMEPKRKSSGRQRPALLCGQPDTAHASAGSRRGARRQREDQRHEQARPQAARQDGTLHRNGHGGSASCEIRQNPASAVSAVLFPLSPVPPEITIPLYVDVHFLHRGGIVYCPPLPERVGRLTYELALAVEICLELHELVAQTEMANAEIHITLCRLDAVYLAARLNAVSERDFNTMPFRRAGLLAVVLNIPAAAHAVIGGTELDHIHAGYAADLLNIVDRDGLFDHEEQNDLVHAPGMVHLRNAGLEADEALIRVAEAAAHLRRFTPDQTDGLADLFGRLMIRKEDALKTELHPIC